MDRTTSFRFSAVCLIVVLLFPCLARAIEVDGLRCDYRDNPLGIDNPQPRLSWTLHSDVRGDRQTAYQILVAGDPDKLDAETGDLWDSGRVESDRSIHVVYQGKPLKSRKIYYWKVRAWDREGNASAWSRPAVWETALMSPDDWRAAWLTDGKPTPQKDEDFYKEDPAPLFRKEFTLDKEKEIARARLYITGIGYYEASLNGLRVGDRLLDPGWTRYEKRVLYSTYDVTDQLSPGTNCLGVTLGNGWYNLLPLRMWGSRNLREALPTGRPRFIARLEVEFTDGTRRTVVSDASWKTTEGPIRCNSIYLGEIYDARKEIPGWNEAGLDDSSWCPAVATEEPIGRLWAQNQPPIRAIETIRPVTVTEPKPGVYIFDMGENFGGWVDLKLSAPAGTKITLRYGELLYPDGTLNPMTSVCGQIKGTRQTADGGRESVGGPGAPPIAWQSDTYITRGGEEETYTPRFTFRAFRYVEVTGCPSRPPLEAITGRRLSADVRLVGSFECSNEQFNRIQQMCDRTFRSNLFSVQSDCPHREKFGYGGDLVVTGEALMMNYDMTTFYAKEVRDWRDSALPDGMFTDTAPFVGIQYCGLAWAMAHPLIQRQLYQYAGDRQLIEEQYEASRRWLDLMVEKYPDRIVTDGLSDHEALVSAPPQVMVTPLFAASARIVGEMAAILGRDDEAKRYQQLAEDIRRAYLEKFLDASGKIGPGTQAAQLFSLYENLVPDEQRPAVMQVLLDDIRGPRQDHLSTGIFGTKFLLDVLSREGHADLAYTIVDQKTCPGWGYMLENDATTLWEHWKGSDNTYSHNHPMFGSVSQWFYQWLGGIQPDPAAVGFDRIILRPQMLDALDYVTCQYDSARGMIVSRWRRDGDRVRYEVEIPVGATALVYLPAERAEQITEAGKPIGQALGIESAGTDAGCLLYRIGSGRYAFEIDETK